MPKTKGRVMKEGSEKPKMVRKKVGKGVYTVQSTERKDSHGRPDECFYIRYPIYDQPGKTQTEKIGWKSEGYAAETAEDIRNQRIRVKKHGESALTAKEIKVRERKKEEERLKQEEQNRLEEEKKSRPLSYIGDQYFKEKAGVVKGIKTDLNRYENHIKPALGDRTIASLSEIAIKDFEKKLERKEVDEKYGKRASGPLSDATVSNIMELLRRLVNYGVKNDLGHKPKGLVIKPKKKTNTVTEYLTPDEAGRFIKVLDSWEVQDAPRMLKLAMFTGMRKSEIFKLEDRDLDFNKGFITIRDAKSGGTEQIPMSNIARGILLEQIKSRDDEYPESSYIFPGRYGGLRVSCTAAKRIKKKADLPDGFRIFHGLRHHYAVSLAESGEFTMDMISDLLTHKDPRLTYARYAKFTPEKKKKMGNDAANVLMRVVESGSDKVARQDKGKNVG